MNCWLIPSEGRADDDTHVFLSSVVADRDVDRKRSEHHNKMPPCSGGVLGDSKSGIILCGGGMNLARLGYWECWSSRAVPTSKNWERGVQVDEWSLASIEHK